MNEVWFDPNVYSWIPGTLYGTLGGLWGGVAGSLAPRGSAKRLVLGLGYLFIVIGLALLLMSIVAYLTGQPYGIWYGLGLPGLLGLVLFPSLLPVVLARYREAEERKLRAKDLG